MVNIITKTLAGLLSAAALQAHALQIISLTPQSEVAQVRQVVVKFDESVANFGDRPAPETPLLLSTMIVVGSINFLANNGASPRIAVCG